MCNEHTYPASVFSRCPYCDAEQWLKMNEHLPSALRKLDERTAKAIILTPDEAKAILDYIAHHGLSSSQLMAWERPRGKRRSKQKEI